MNKEAPLGVTLVGITNILVGIFFTVALYLLFVFGVIFCYADLKDTNLLYWIWYMIIARLSVIISTFSSLSLIWAGIAILIMKNYSRKLTIASLLGIIPIGIFALFDILFFEPKAVLTNIPETIIPISLTFCYLLITTVYLNRPSVKYIFVDKEVKFRYWKFIVIVIIVFVLPLLAMKPYVIPPPPPPPVYIPTN